MSESGLESAAKALVGTKVLIGTLLGLIVGAFVTGFAMAERYKDLKDSYIAIQALQQNEWGKESGDAKPVYAKGATDCPNGSYMVGVSTDGPSTGISVITPHCRQLKLQ